MGRGLQAAPGLVCFDLDGTLYHDDRIYLRMIDYYFAGTPWEKETGSVKAEMSRVLAGGNPAFRCGRFAPKEWGVCPGPAAALLAVPTEAALLRPDPSPWLDRRCWSYISDGWSLAMYLARRIGWDGEAFWERFQLARRDLLTDGVGPQPDPVLAGRLLRLRDRGIRLVLCSNSRREGGEALLARLGLLGCFDEQIFDAEKPHATTKRMEGWSARWGIPSDAMLFVGDQGYGDLYAGLRAGARTLRVSPYPADDEGLWDACIRTQEGLKELLAAWC